MNVNSAICICFCALKPHSICYHSLVLLKVKYKAFRILIFPLLFFNIIKLLKCRILNYILFLQKVIKTVHYGPLPGLSSGTWWGIRMDCSRDFVHEPFHDHIHDGPYGAVSVCTSHLNPHSDVDLGDVLTFTSRDYSANDHSKDSLILSYKNRVPIRLVRSYSLSNEYAPKTGYRYDGLYTVVYYWIGVSADSTKHRKFVLTRVKDQEPPPWMAKKSNSLKAAKSKKSTTPRLTRSHTNVSSQEPKKKKKFVFKKIEKEAPKVDSAIVSRQVFQKFTPGSPDSSPKVVSSTDSESQSSCPNACPTKLCNTNLSIRTNLYNSQSQNVKKAAPMTMCKLFRSNQSVHACQKNSDDEISKVSTSETSDSESTDKNSSLNCSTSSECKEKKVKKVTWADTTTSSNSLEKSPTKTGNGFQYSSCGVIDGFSPTSPKKCGVLKCNNNMKELSSTQTSKPNNILNSSTKPSQHIVQVHSRSTVPQPPKSSFAETEMMDDEPSSNIDTLAPDKLVNAIIKEKFHPMAKLLIGNMIGLENQESSILNAYNTLTSKTDQDDTKQSKENKLRNKFYMKNNKSRKNGMLKRQRREIANLIIDAKFNNTVTRASTRNNRHLRTTKLKISKSELPQRKIMNARRIQSRNLNMDIRARDLQSQQQQQPKKDRERPGKRKAEDLPATTATTATTTMITRTKRPKMVTMWTQCTLLAPSTVDQGVQVGSDCIIMEEDIKVEELDEPWVIKREPGEAESSRDAQEASTSRVEPRRTCMYIVYFFFFFFF